jgi:hypothetical protein
MARLNPSVFSRKHLRENDHKMSQPLDQTPTTSGRLGSWTRKETQCAVTYERRIGHHNLTEMPYEQ